jgi:hypothetical protein
MRSQRISKIRQSIENERAEWAAQKIAAEKTTRKPENQQGEMEIMDQQTELKRKTNWRKSNWPPRGVIFAFEKMEQAKSFAVAVKNENVCGLDSRVFHDEPHVHVCWELERYVASKKAWDEACAVERRIEKMAAEFKRNA